METLEYIELISVLVGPNAIYCSVIVHGYYRQPR